jgi:hypothetical protein
LPHLGRDRCRRIALIADPIHLMLEASRALSDALRIDRIDLA